MLVVSHVSSAYLTSILPQMHPLLRGSMVESPKPKTSASCPTTLRNKSASPTPTPFVDGGTPATFSMDSLQEIQEYLSRAREGIRKDKKVGYALECI